MEGESRRQELVRLSVTAAAAALRANPKVRQAVEKLHGSSGSAFKLLWAEGLDFLNARRHIFEGGSVAFQHGDIKPNNILLVGDEAKLADYGMSTPMITAATPCYRQGTLEYAAPEIFQGTLTETSDQFSLAVTYYLLRTGAFPYPTLNWRNGQDVDLPRRVRERSGIGCIQYGQGRTIRGRCTDNEDRLRADYEIDHRRVLRGV